MSLAVREIMQADVRTVDPGMSLTDLEREFIEEKVGGFPVVEGGKLIGTVSRSDVVRQLCVEQSLSEVVSDYYSAGTAFGEKPEESLEAIADRVGRRIEHLCVRDVMIRKLITVSPEATVRDAARLLVDHHVHRVLVTEGEKLVGIVTTMDLARLVAEGRS